MRCGWCGRFVKADTPPIYGRTLNKEIVGQILCPECGPHWVDMVVANEKRLAILEGEG